MQTKQELKDILQSALDRKVLQRYNGVEWVDLTPQQALGVVCYHLTNIRIKPKQREKKLYGNPGVWHDWNDDCMPTDTHCITLIETDGKWAVQGMEELT